LQVELNSEDKVQVANISGQ